MKKIPIVLDVDTGTDDAIAIICSLLCDKLDVRAFTTVAGNVSVDYTSKNTLDLIDFLGSDIKVAVGADKPLCRPLHIAKSHGSSGLGDVVLPEATRGFYNKNAVDTIYEEALSAEGELHLVALGPLTNVASALMKYPDLKDKIKHITIMGGALAGGNMTMTAEFNTYVDPEAAKIVFESGIPLTMVGLDVTLKTVIPLNVFELIKSFENKYAQMATRIFDFILRRSSQYGFDVAHIHDALALASVVEPNLIETKKYYMTVETKGEFTTGMTVADFNRVAEREPNVDAAASVDLRGFWDWVIRTLND